MAYNTPETVADYLARFQMEITHRGKGTFTPDHVKYSLTIASGGKDFFTTFESNPHVHGEPTITQVFGALASDAMVVRDYGMDEFVDEFCDGMKPSAAIRAYNSCKETYDWMRDGLYLSNGDIASLSEVISENEEEMRALAAFFNGEKSDMSDFVNPYGGNHILVSGSVGRWNGTSTGIAVYKDFDAATDCSPSRFGQGNVFADCEIQKVWDENGTLYLAGAHHVSSPMRASAFGNSSITRIICPSMGLPPWESTMSLAMRTGSSTTSITARNSAPPPPLRGAVLRMPF